MFSFQTVLSRQIPERSGLPPPEVLSSFARICHANNARSANPLQTMNVPRQDPVQLSK